MSSGEQDFDDLKMLNLEPKIEERIRQARIEARQIINSLEPLHISNWADLLLKLETALEKARMNAGIFNPPTWLSSQA